MFTLSRGEWTLVGLVGLTVVTINKLVVHDHGNNWPTLVLLSFIGGLAVAHTAQRLRRRKTAQRK